MQIGREEILQRKAELEARRAYLIACANACNGAIEVCDHLLAVLEQPEPASAPSPETTE